MSVETKNHQWRGVKQEIQDEQDAGVGLRAPSRRLLADLIRPWRAWLLFLVVVVVAEAGARLYIPVLVRQVLDHGLTADRSVLYTSVALMLGAILVQIVARATFLRRSGRIGNSILFELRRRLFTKFQRLDIRFHDHYTSGRAISRMSSDVEGVQELVLQGLDVVIIGVLTIVGASVIMLSLDWRLAVVAFLTYPLLLLLMRWFARASTRAFRAVRTRSAIVIVQFIETMTGIKAVQAFRREPRSAEIFRSVALDYRDANVRAMRVFARAMPGIQAIGNLGIVVVVLAGGYFAIGGTVSVGTMAAFVLYVRMFFDPMQDLSQFISSLQSALTALEKVSSVMEEEPQVDDPAEPTPLPAARGQVTFDDVDFSYIEGTTVLPGLSLDIPAGQTLALVGTTGAGKTTIAKLIARFYDPDAGAVRLDGVDLRDLDDDTLRRHVTLLTQENFIFAGSIADNIRFGRPDATREEVEAAARALGAHTFIEEMPDGYDTDTGKRGGRLSAGQRQLIAFSRVMLADPKVLILDEATSSMDIPTERLVQQALGTILADRTAIIIAHRLSTVEVADRVLVLQHGQVVEDGVPSELVKGEGRYADLHRAWIASLA
ncbi:ABC transporter ATP-binding protein [Tessaracoccus caeni]|uniref:ABC transporter ATP-binding protein n=1 Tax=Tessaracoccus caeni TaxID=3031239 RepID=UPI0023DCD3CF|nr:ABC transporter ATP-binding protein [Tessaracoccus caeni]MDF1488164.1 ABC transporter ATP-binding protein [Tessaracoccus caeni]